MANTAGVSVQFKQDAMAAILNGASALKAALYLASATTGAANTAYTATGEVSGTNYTAGGVAVSNANAVQAIGSTAYWTPSANIQYPNVTLSTSFDAVMIYDTARANKAIGVWTFSPQTVIAGTLTLVMPANDAANALLRS